ncbi:pulmonary surfactant-associated protein B-like [Protopterus annectens]|uniref:pulmonary surfactant-associated protein B-like n=1 Tax=Protopterus annectens TaxID=7888 RepID=UPI001CFA4092|nr:pulmonary surfactant-associated protein B-like [Protopterus annectens]
MALLLLVLFSITSAAICDQVFQHDECEQGEEFWCQDLQSATHCDKVPYCTKYIWGDLEQVNFKEESPMIKCFACKRIMKRVKKSVGEVTDKEEIKEKLDAFCTELRFMRRICSKLMNKFKDRIADALSEESDARGICVTLGLCKEAYTF